MLHANHVQNGTNTRMQGGQGMHACMHADSKNIKVDNTNPYVRMCTGKKKVHKWRKTVHTRHQSELLLKNNDTNQIIVQAETRPRTSQVPHACREALHLATAHAAAVVVVVGVSCL